MALTRGNYMKLKNNVVAFHRITKDIVFEVRRSAFVCPVFWEINYANNEKFSQKKTETLTKIPSVLNKFLTFWEASYWDFNEKVSLNWL